MQNKHYRKHLKEAVRWLYCIEDGVFDAIVNIAFAGIYREIAKVHEDNELVEMNPAYFEDTGDQSVEALMKLFKGIQFTKQKIMHLNVIDEKEAFDDA